MSPRFPRVEALLGGSLEQVTYAQLASLVGNPDAREDEDLDYKGPHYSADQAGRAELAKDVAALANGIGGVLVLGLAEDRRTSIPNAVTPVELTDGKARQIRQTIASNLRPTPRIELFPKHDQPGSIQGILLIAVPRSLDAPHAIVEQTRLAYPRRNGSTTAWLTEAEIATAYRRRFEQLADRTDRISRIDHDVEETAERLEGRSFLEAGDPLLTVSLVPDIPGDMVIDHASVQRVSTQELAAVPLLGRTAATFYSSMVGARRIVLFDDRPPRYVAELHSDGSGAWAARTPLLGIAQDDSNTWPYGADTDSIVTLVLSALRHLAQHAVTRTGAAGTAALRVRLESQTPIGGGPMRLPNLPRTREIHLAHEALVPQETGVRASATAHRSAGGHAHALLNDLADGGIGLVQAASLLISDLFQHYGLAEPPQISRDGSIIASGWSEPERTQISTWAQQVSVPVT
ncbi:AlbA family DNA-binding domain-containing protein [Streptomyces mirabilis]|uniref:AlbA family DNA-binding domain-containing protein n=1 Tax=Streptomyces mirabilis TaxID=68239 RepID=UPI00225864CF|nr:ATP-binding protein [Streptomyces mirabilis]MCX4427022.1 ATP-binding protein [Streptomyces mirabilis]